MFAGNFPPLGWAFCDGQTLPIAVYDTLFSLIGTTYGGDGQTTFRLPDLRGRLPVHMGQGPGLSNYTIGQTAGTEVATLNTNEIPAHTHAFAPATSEPADRRNPRGALFARTTEPAYAPPPLSGSMAPGVSGNAGGSQPHPNLQPYLCVNFIIALEGIYPSRS